MALIRKIEEENAEKKENKKPLTGLTFPTKNNDAVSDYYSENKDNTNISANNTSATTSHQPENVRLLKDDKSISNWLLEFFSEDFWLYIKSNEKFANTHINSELSTKRWLTDALDIFLGSEYKDILRERINSFLNNQNLLNETLSIANNELSTLREQLSSSKNYIEDLKKTADEASVAKFRIQKKLNAAIPLENLISEFYDSAAPIERRMIKLFSEALEDLTEELAMFLVKFTNGWNYVKSVIVKPMPDGVEFMEKVHEALSYLMGCISGVYIAQRRLLLDLVAKACSELFTDYEFISPEQSLQIDPSVHNAEGLGGGTVKEGVTFAVIRKESRKAVKYATVIVN